MTNTGDAPLNFGSADPVTSPDGSADFYDTTDTCRNSTVPAGQTCTVEIVWQANHVGDRTGNLRLSDDAGGPHDVPLSGTATSDSSARAAVNVSPSSLAFQDQATGTSSALQTVTVTNSGTASALFGTDPIDGNDPKDFVIAADACANGTVDPGQSCTIAVAFGPQAPGARSATLKVGDNAPGAPHSVGLAGNGVVGGARDCPAGALTPWQRTRARLDRVLYLRGALKAVRKTLRHPPRHEPVALRARMNGLVREILKDLRRLHARASDGPLGLTESEASKCVDEVSDAYDTYLNPDKPDDPKAAQIKQIGKDLLALRNVLTRPPTEITSDERQKIIEDVLVGLAAGTGDEKKGELAGDARELADYLQKQLKHTATGKDDAALLKKNITKLVKRIAASKYGKDAAKQSGELASQVITLYDVLAGNLDDKKRAEVLESSVIGLLSRLGAKALIESPQVKAFVLGAKLGAPVGRAIVTNLVPVRSRALWLTCTEALNKVATDRGKDVETDVGLTTPQFTDAGLYDGWSCSTLRDKSINAGRLTIYAIQGERSTLQRWFGKDPAVVYLDYDSGKVVGGKLP